MQGERRQRGTEQSACIGAAPRPASCAPHCPPEHAARPARLVRGRRITPAHASPWTITDPSLPQFTHTHTHTQSVPPLALRILRGPAAGRTVTPSAPPTSATSLALGRKPGRDLQIPDPGVSEGHALLEWEARKKGGAWTIRDVGSSNGTRHNGEELVREGASHDLEDGDELMLGTHTVAVVEVCVRERGGE